MPSELTSPQCDAFLQDHNVEIKRSRYEIRDTHPWCCTTSGDKLPNTIGKTRQQAITNYQQEHHSDWIPPVIHDAEWALEYVKEKNIRLEYIPYGGQRGDFWRAIQYNMHKAIGTTVENVVLAWKTEYDPDKPTREEAVNAEERSAVELLKEVWNALPASVIPIDLACRVSNLITKEVDDD